MSKTTLSKESQRQAVFAFFSVIKEQMDPTTVREAFSEMGFKAVKTDQDSATGEPQPVIAPESAVCLMCGGHGRTGGMTIEGSESFSCPECETEPVKLPDAQPVDLQAFADNVKKGIAETIGGRLFSRRFAVEEVAELILGIEVNALLLASLTHPKSPAELLNFTLQKSNIRTDERPCLPCYIDQEDCESANTMQPDMPAICKALGFDPTNHHNAAKCPYCTPSQPTVPEGWKLVPIEPTVEMKNKAWQPDHYGYGYVSENTGIRIYKAMLAAAPTSKEPS
jgi:hypothetical protein